jgi:hypothetical protein
MDLLLGLDGWQLVVDCDRQSSDVGLVVLFHAHACLETGEKISKKRKWETEKGQRERRRRKTSFIIMLRATLSIRFVEFSINSPLDNRRGSPLDPPLDVENARPRSTPGITTEVNNPCPLQNSRMD